MRSFLNLQSASLGFDTAPLMTMRVFMTGTKYETADAKAQRVEDIVQRVEALPGVQAAFASKLIPLGDGGGTSPVVIEGKPVDPGKEPSVGFVGTTPHLRRTLNIALLRGRDFSEPENRSRRPSRSSTSRWLRACGATKIRLAGDSGGPMPAPSG